MAEPSQVYYVTKAHGRSGRVYNLLAPDGTTQLYTIVSSDKKPHITVWRHTPSPQPYPPPQIPSYQQHPQFFTDLPTPPPYDSSHHGTPQYPPSQESCIGTASYSSFSSKIHVSLDTPHQGREKGPSTTTNITMKRPDILSSGRSFVSPMGTTFHWRKDANVLVKTLTGSTDLKLVDHRGRVIARYEKHEQEKEGGGGFNLKGLMALVGGGGGRGKLVVATREEPGIDLDMIVITGFAVIEDGKRSDEEWEEVAEFI
ncbi:predicted protein [Uncinocarpus reesii 1704]|uniref:Uncharacterized protein n=1 Tax=Uncinocarpus reesii (strain UAMH 1704) TaxID=336963 RepID=C4JER6_UNCRE|nr:uncharacterized protein UREG_02226 [Uncinocarpus reesii 1704]EEP77377.1 predicted protein [Uncinocarpus reesii 1704]